LRKNKSAIKRALQGEARRLRNSHVKSTMRTAVKKVVSASDGAGKEHLEETFRSAEAYIDKAASKGVIHRNTAARKIGRLSRKVHSSMAAKG
jgi:small subunit ribosomal protein S20